MEIHLQQLKYKEDLASTNSGAQGAFQPAPIELTVYMMTDVPKTMKAIRLVKVACPNIAISTSPLSANLRIIAWRPL